MKVLDLTRRSTEPVVQIEAIGAAEMLVSLATFLGQDDRKTVESGEAWFENIETRISAGLKQQLAWLGPGCSKLWMSLSGLLLEGAPRSAEQLLERLQALQPEEIRLHLLGYYMPAHRPDHAEGIRVTAEQIRRAADGDKAAQQALLDDALYCAHTGGDALKRLLELDAERTKEMVLDLLRGWYEEYFAAEEKAAFVILEREVQLKRRQLAGLPPSEWIVKASGIDYVPEPGIERIVLAPQIAMRPWVMIVEARDTRFIFYPVSDEALLQESAAPPARLVRLHRALGDEKRLRILRFLADRGAATLQEVADEIGIAKSTAHHHLVQLRSAGLTQVTTGDEWRWQLRRDALPEGSALLEAYLR